MENLVSAIKGKRFHSNLQTCTTGAINAISIIRCVFWIIQCQMLTGYSSNFVVSEKVKVPAGETRRATLSVPATELALYTTAHGWEIEPGDFEIQIGRSSDNILFRKKFTYRQTDADRFKL